MCQAIKMDMWVTHGMMRAICQATKRELKVSGGGNRWRRTKRRKKRKRGKGERKEDSAAYSSDFRGFDDRSSSGRELKSVYATRVTLQEV